MVDTIAKVLYYSLGVKYTLNVDCDKLRFKEQILGLSLFLSLMCVYTYRTSYRLKVIKMKDKNKIKKKPLNPNEEMERGKTKKS